MMRHSRTAALLSLAMAACLAYPAVPTVVNAADELPNLTATVAISPESATPGDAAVVTVTVTNSGTAAASGFVVELTANPRTVSTQANQVADSTLSPPQNLSWVVTTLEPAGSVTLTSDALATVGVKPQAAQSAWGDRLAPGISSLAVYVDNYSDDGSANGAVFESNEADNAVSRQISAPSGPTARSSGRLFLPILGLGAGAIAPPPPTNSPFEAAQAFRPKPNGFKFENYGKPENTTNTINANDLVQLFGRTAVCENASGDCILTGPARQWRDKEVAGLNGGQCYGMAVAASRMFDGADNPTTFKPGATTPFEIDVNEQVQNHIAYYFLTQAFDTKDKALGGWIQGKKPSEILELLRQGLRKNESYVIGFFKPGFVGGHAVTPYAIQDMGDKQYRLFVYDNNWPDKERFFTFNLNNETWRYDFGATVPGEPVDLYEGTETSDTFRIRSMASHPASGYECPFCAPAAGVAAAEGRIGFDFNGEGRMLLTDPQGKRQGYNPLTRKNLSEIPGATTEPFVGGLGKDIPGLLEVPAAITGTYQVVLSGNEITATNGGDLTITTPGMVVGFTDLQLEPTDELTFTISADLRELSIASSSTASMGMYIAQETDADDSYVVEIDEIEVQDGETFSITYALDQKLTLRTSSSRTISYDFSLTRIDATPGDTEFSQDEYEVPAGYDFQLDFGAWDGTDADTVPVFVDSNGDGSFRDDGEPGNLTDEP